MTLRQQLTSRPNACGDIGLTAQKAVATPKKEAAKKKTEEQGQKHL
jgi:hypothetical protein